MSLQLEAILDRVHAVNVEIKTVYSGFDLNPQRYYPRTRDIATLPVITPVFISATHSNEVYGSNELTSVLTIQNVLFVDNFMAGDGTSKTAQDNTEKCIDHIVSEYWKRPRLELLEATDTQSAGAFNCIMEDARLTNTAFGVADDLAIVRFTLTIETTNDFERI